MAKSRNSLGNTGRRGAIARDARTTDFKHASAVAARWVGWASAGRSAIRDESTDLMSTTYDGYWIIALSKRGIVGYTALFSMLLLPVYLAYRALPRIRGRSDRVIACALSLMICINVFDLIPNATVEGYLTMMSGAPAGLIPGIQREQEARRREEMQAHGIRIVGPKNRTAALLKEKAPRD